MTEINAAPGSVIIERVLALWDRQNGWIPGGAREALAEALGVDPALVRSSQDIKRGKILDAIAADGETYTLLDGDGHWWLYVSYRDLWEDLGHLGTAMVASGFDRGVDGIHRSFGIRY